MPVTFVALPYATSFLTGLLVCGAISLITGRKEAWDSSAYFMGGIPVMTVAAYFLGRKFPDRAWRWTLCMAAGQAAAMATAGNSWNLWPLSLLAFGVLSVPQFVAGAAGARHAKKTP